ncbi:hypothetical protein JCM10450v2_001323 [Rhodotorula kratochvilovae]
MAALAPPFEQTYPLSPPSTPPPLLVGDACTLPGAAPALQHFKLSHASTTRLLALPLAQLSYPALLVAAAALFALPLGAVRALQHTDADGDVVTLSSEAELRALLALQGESGAVRLQLVVEEEGAQSIVVDSTLSEDALAADLPTALDPGEDDRPSRSVSRGRSRGIGQRHASPAPSTCEGQQLERAESLGRRLMTRLSRRSMRSETGTTAPPPAPPPPLPSLSRTSSLASSSSNPAAPPVRPALLTRRSTTRLLSLRSSPSSAATAQPPPAPLPLARRKSLAALANFLAPNRHIASSSSSSTSTPGDAQQGEQAPEAPPSYYHVLRMTAAQEGGAQRLGRGLVGACE